MKQLFLGLLTLTLSLSAYARDTATSRVCLAMTGYVKMGIETGSTFSFEDFNANKSYRDVDLNHFEEKEDQIRIAFLLIKDMYQMNKDPAQILKKCKETVGDEMAQDGREQVHEVVKTAGLVSSSVVGLYTKDTVVSAAARMIATPPVYTNNCDRKNATSVDLGDCTIASPALSLPTGFREYMLFEEKKYDVSKKTISYSPDDCLCIASTLVREKKDVNAIMAQSELEQEKLNKVIQKAVGKKLINEYAALSEDLQYYAATNAWVMKEGQATEVDPKKLCQDATDFEDAVEKQCKENGTSEGSKARLSELLGSFDSSLSKKTFAEGLKSLVKDIATFTVDSKGLTKGKSNLFTRVQYDEARYTLSKDEPQVQVANEIISMMLMDEGGMKKILMDHIAKGKSPLHSAMDVLTGADPKHADYIFSKLSQNYASDNKIFKQLRSEIGSDIFKDKMDTMFFVALNLHPGLKNLMNDRELFKKTANLVNPESKDPVDLLSIMNREKKLFNAHMESRCEAVQKRFAEAVCTKPADLRKKVGPRDVQALTEVDLAYTAGSKDAKDMALCQMSMNSVAKDSVFSQLSMGNLNPYEGSDYLDRKLHPTQQQNGLAQMAFKVSTDKKFAEKLNEASSKYDYARVGTGDYKSSAVSQILAGKNSNASEVNMSQLPGESSAAHKASSVAQSVFDQTNKAFSAPAVVAPVPSVASVAPQAVSEVKSEEKKESSSTPSYERLSKELASSEDKVKVRSHMNDINEADAQEILRLRDQALKDQQTISDMKIQEEKNKTEALKKEYEQLKNRFDHYESPVERSVSSVSGSTERSAERGIPRFETTSLSAPQTAAMNTTGGRSSGGGQFAGAGSVQDASGASSNAAAGSNTSAAQKDNNDARLAMNLVVVASNGSEGKDRSSEDPNKVLINYLTKNEPSVSQLQELKERGLLYTEEDLSIEGKKVQKKKLIKFSELSAEAKVLIERKLASVKVQEVKRNYSRQALMLELFTISLKKSNLSVKKSGPVKL